MTDAAANLPANRLRASSELREAAQIALNTALEDGQLDYEEMQERIHQVVRVTYRNEITELLQDLSFPSHLPAASDSKFLDVLVAAHEQGITNLKDYSVEPAPKAAAVVSQYPDRRPGESISFAVFGGAVKKGPWICAAKHTAVCAFGVVSIDLRNAELSAPTTVINVAANFGGIDVIVPEHCRIKLQILPVFGGSNVRESKKLTVKQHDLPPEAPVVVVRGYVAFGGINIRRLPSSS